MKELSLDLGERSYKIHIEAGCISGTGNFMRELFGATKRKVCIATTETVAALYLPEVRKNIESAGYDVFPLVVPDGENYKTFEIFENIVSALIKERFERKSVMVPLGGGVIGDMAGFAAATYLRGIPFIQIPTTIVAQIDSSIGGKVAINHGLGKNMVGCFYQPKGVWIDTRVLSTLEKRERIGGMAEAVKHAVIRDNEFFEFIDSNADTILDVSHDDIMEAFIYRNCMIKAGVVSADERESGIRAILNYGHTIGHALEAVTDFGRFIHGEAVMLGMISASWIACKKGILKKSDMERQNSLILRIGVNRNMDGIDTDRLIDLMKSDKKVSDGKIRFVLPKKIGEANIYENVGLDEIRGAVEFLKDFLK